MSTTWFCDDCGWPLVPDDERPACPRSHDGLHRVGDHQHRLRQELVKLQLQALALGLTALEALERDRPRRAR